MSPGELINYVVEAVGALVLFLMQRSLDERDRRIGAIEKTIDTRIALTEDKFQKLHDRLTAAEKQDERAKAQLENIEKVVNRIERTLERLAERVDRRQTNPGIRKHDSED